eukprot:4271580-Amphidinium_carterae.1
MSVTLLVSLPEDHRGGGKKAAPQARLTWEGESATSMLTVQSSLLSAAGAALVQLHSSALCKDAEGYALVNWSSWAQMAGLTSAGNLLLILPGHRAFETDKPEDGRVHKGDLVILDPTTERRFPRLVTMVQMGSALVKIDKPREDAAAPTPSAPVELILEIDGRAAVGTDFRAQTKKFLEDALLAATNHHRLYSIRSNHEDTHVLFSAKLRLNVVGANKVLQASGRAGIFAKPTKHSVDLVTKVALVWINEDEMDSRPLNVLTNLQSQLGSSGGLCRSRRVFGIRVEPRFAGRARATLGVQAAQQFSWNETMVPKQHYLI